MLQVVEPQIFNRQAHTHGLPAENNTDHTMVILLKGIMNAKRILSRSSLHANHASEVPKGYFAVYVGESQKKRFTLPISFLNQPSFQETNGMGNVHP
ncbi:auxin-responsive protein [Salix suchowensis]|nr:auxin-responsive protein [Salix suchowensis]